jgi:Bacterial Ig-like domain (group 3)/Putative Ig domain
MLTRIHLLVWRGFSAAVACLITCLVLLPWVSAAANPTVPVMPFLDCVRFNGDETNPVYTAYFGYNNTGPVPFTFTVGADNAVAPGSSDAGQPTTFNVGNYPRVFPVQFDGVFVKEVSWELNGATATASASSPACTSGVTAAASDVASDSATLTGVVTPEGQDVTYSFEYGTSPSLGQATTTQDAGAVTQPELVQTALTGLTPSTQYFFRLDTTSDLSGTTHGQQQSFTTPAAAQTTPPLALSTTTLPHATFGTPYTASLAATGGTPMYSWKLTDGSLPAALSLAAGSGTISGTPTAVGTSHFTATVSDASTPSPQTATEPLSITVDPAATSARLTASANPLRPRRTVTYTATVSRTTPGSGVPTGKVTFSNNGAAIRCTGGSQTLNAAGVATCTISYTAPGTHTITAG